MTAANGQNDDRFDDGMKLARELGRHEAEGGDALPQLAVLVCKLAAQGVIDLTPDKHGKGIDDVKQMFGAYAESGTKKAVHLRSADGLKTNVSKLRQVAKMGVMVTCDPIAVIDRVHQAWMAQAKVDRKSVKAPYPTYVDAARMQQNFDVDLTDEQIGAVILKADAKEQTVEGILTRVQTQLDQLITGEKGLKDQDPCIVAARAQIAERLAAFTQDRETEKDEAEIVRLTAKGYNVIPAEMRQAAE